ncbi:hypothetical protein ABH940_006502 [Streptacidiphilus sp. BW17]|uniref:pectinesterase family protein n=1 Tax=Streptacidiphilus sp. BW17 TaxID=3156274 RepID=UPI0035124C1D
MPWFVSSGAACALALAAIAPLTPAPAHADDAPYSAAVQGGSGRACTDSALALTFPTPPTLGDSGRIEVHRADGSVADSIDLADPATYQRTIGGATDASGAPHEFSYTPVIIAGGTATIYLHHQLDYDQHYYVTVDPGVFNGFAGISNPDAFAFRTRTRPPRTDARTLVVDARGHGDFCTVQGAIDAVPPGDTKPVTIRVGPGTYTELDWVPPTKPHLTVEGAGQGRTVIQYTNNNTLNSAHTTSVCIRQLIPGHDANNCWRGAFNDEADDFTLRDLTIRNTTPYGGSQAEAFRGNADRITLDRVSLFSYQDTLRLQGRGFVTHSVIEGDVDFTWGFGAVLIQDSELRSLHAGYVTQVRNDATHHGYVFLRDRLTAAPAVPAGSVYLGRIDPTVYPYSQAVFIDTAMGPQIAPAGWQLDNADCSRGGTLQFDEYHSTDLAGAPVDTSARLACSTQLTAAQAAVWSDPSTVLDGWDPTPGRNS